MGSKVVIGYNDRKVVLDSSPNIRRDLSKKTFSISIAGSCDSILREEGYDFMEQTAQLYLIKKAITRENGEPLARIDKIMQDFEFDPISGEMKLTLRGRAVYN